MSGLLHALVILSIGGPIGYGLAWSIEWALERRAASSG